MAQEYGYDKIQLTTSDNLVTVETNKSKLNENELVIVQDEKYLCYKDEEGNINKLNDYDNEISNLNTRIDENYTLANSKEDLIIRKTGFNLNKSDSVTLNDSNTLSTSKATKTAYDKGLEALGVANANTSAIDLITSNSDETILFDGSSINTGIITLNDDWDNYKQIIFIARKTDLTNTMHTTTYTDYIIASDETLANRPNEYSIYYVGGIYKALFFRDTNRNELYVNKTSASEITKIIGIGKKQ